MAYLEVECKGCGSSQVVRFGTDRKGVQRFLCKSCGRTFVDNNAPPGMRFPTEVIASAINQFYESSSLHKIRRTLHLDFGKELEHTSILRWVVRYTRVAVKELGDIPVKVGSVWVADETVLKLKEEGGRNVWFWDIIDEKTRFLLASHLSVSRYTRDAQILMERAERRANRIPKTVITDKLRSYLDAIERTWGADTEHVQSGPFIKDRNGDSTRAIERFHGTLKDRTKVMRALANRESARLVMEGWLVHYNFFRPHSGLGGKTPAEAAGVKSAPFKTWADVVVGVRPEPNPVPATRVTLVPRRSDYAGR
ncbi:MAG: IS1/IS6 family transposase [Chloroflexi bacterium]|nr:IS1/IS6 family transposase [Chloroflexota bacterium]